MVGACAKGSLDAEFSLVFTDDNVKNAGGHSLGGEVEVALGGGGVFIVLPRFLNLLLLYS